MVSTFFKIVFLILLTIVTLLSLLTSPIDGPSGSAFTRFLSKILFKAPEHADKIGHFIAYAALGFSATAAQFIRIQKSWIIFLGLSIYGYFMEYLQLLGGTRMAEFMDGISNMLGSGAGIIGYIFIVMLSHKLLNKYKQS